MLTAAHKLIGLTQIVNYWKCVWNVKVFRKISRNEY